MTDSNCITSPTVSESITYPTLVTNRDYHHVAEDKKKYSTPLRLSTKALSTYLKNRLEQQKDLPIRIHALFDDLSLSPLLQQHKQVDVFDLLVELVLLADYDPAQYLSALLAVLDDDVLLDLEPLTIKHSGEFISDALKRDKVRWQLQDYQEDQKEKRKRKKQD